MKILATLILAALGQQVDHNFSRIVKTYGNPPDIFNAFGEKNNYHDLKRLINNAKSPAFRFYLKMIQIDFDVFLALDSKEQARIKSFLKKIHDYNYNPDYKKRISSADEIINNYKRVISIFGDLSYFDFTITGFILTIKADNERNRERAGDMEYKEILMEINREIDRFNGSKWSGSPLLSNLYLLCCYFLEAKKDFVELSKISSTAYNLLNMIALNDSDDILIGAYSYLMISLNKTGDYQKSIKLFEKLSNAILENDQKINSIARIYASAADSYFNLGKFELGESYQEIALSKIHRFYLDLDHPCVIAEAKNLYKMLEKRGKKEEMKKIEERYNLKKYP